MLGLPASGLRELLALVDRYQLHAAPFSPVAIRQVARDEGWQVRYRSGMGRLYGVGVIVGPVRLMVINEQVSEAWQRYAMAHELAHGVLGHGGWFTCAAGELGRAVLVREEVEANIGAALVLLPDAVLGCESVAAAAGACEVPLDLAELRWACGIGMRDRLWQTLVERSA